MFICNEDANLLWQTKKNNGFQNEKQQNMLPGTKHSTMPTLKNADGTINFYKMIRMNDHFENI